MANQDIPHATISEDGTHLTIIDAASHTSRLTQDIDTLIVEGDTLQTFHIVLSEVTDDTIATTDRHWQATTVCLETTIQHTIHRTQVGSLLSILLSLGDFLLTSLGIHLRL